MTAPLHRPARWGLLLVVLAMLAAACGGGEDPDEAEAGETAAPGGTEAAAGSEQPASGSVAGGTVVFGANEEPDVLNANVTAGNLFGTGIITTTMFRPAYMLTPDFEYVPDLIDGEAEVTEDPFTVTYHIKEDAVWSDGTPVSSDDFEFTWQTMVNPDFDITSRTGYELITEAVKEDDKTITFAFSELYAPYRELFSTAGGTGVLPKHALEGEDFDNVWNEAIVNPETGEPIANGPFIFSEWNQGQDLTVVRNEEYWGEPAHLDSIVFRFLEDSNTQVQALRGGEVDMLYPQPQLDLLEQLRSIDGIEVEVNAGTVYEHIDFNFAVPPLDEKFVREAIALGIDRAAIVDAIIAPIQPDAEVLQSVTYVVNQPQYEPHFDQYAYDPGAAVALLEDNGCTRGADDIFVCDGERLSFRYTTTAGNEARELQLQIIQAQLADIGIEIEAATAPPADVFTNILPAGSEGAWDIGNWAWIGSPNPGGNIPIFSCDGDQNYQSYCDEAVTEQLEESNNIIDPAARAALFNEIDAAIAEDVPLLPLYQKPTIFAWNESIQGPQDNPTNQGPTWNVEDWALEH